MKRLKVTYFLLFWRVPETPSLTFILSIMTIILAFAEPHLKDLKGGLSFFRPHSLSLIQYTDPFYAF